MPRYEFSQGTSSKFWDIDLDGRSYTVRFGKIGTEGQAKTKTFPSEDKAEEEAVKLIAEKTKKGYKLVADAKPAKAVPPAKASPVTKLAKAAKPVDPKRLATAIERAKKWMSKNGAEVLVKNLAKPASDAAIAKAEMKLGFQIPGELAALWRIHDGQRTEMNGFIQSMDLLSIRLAVRIQEDILLSIKWMLEDGDMIEEAGLKPDEANEQWIPFASRDSDHLAVHAGTGRVFAVMKDSPPVSLEAKSLTDWFANYAKAMEGGDYTVEEGFGDVYLSGV